MRPRVDLSGLCAEVKARTALPSLAEELGLERVRTLWRCPWHADSSASLSIREKTFRCFGCGKRGDCFSLVTECLGGSFRESLAYLAHRAGVPLPWKAKAPRTAQRRAQTRPLPSAEATAGKSEQATVIAPERRRELLTGLCTAALICDTATGKSHPSLAYLEGRGISPATARACAMGWVADYRRAADWLLARYPLADLQAASLFNAKGYFRLYRHRLLIPYRLDSQVLGLQARDTEWSKDRGGPKELTLGPVAIPFNADALLGEPGQVFITEGAIDCLSLIEQGFSAVAIPGAGNFRREWVGLFEGWDVLLALDADPAGRAATDRIARLFNAAGQTVRVLELPAGSDINDLLTAA